MRNTFWTEGLATLRRLTGKSEAAARGYLGRLLRDLRDDCAAGLSLIRQAETDQPGDPAAWLMAAAREHRGERQAARPEHPLSRTAQMRRLSEIFNIADKEPEE